MISMWRSILIVLLICLNSIVLADEEWGGIFALDSTMTYTWSAQKVDGAYAEDHMTMFIYPVAGANDTELEVAHEAYEVQRNVTGYVLVTTSTGNSTLLLETPLKLVFNSDTWMSLFTLQVPHSGYYAVLAEHDPEEFVATDHYLKDADGNDVEPVYSANGHSHDDHEDEDEKTTRWGETMGACFAVWVVTFIGIVFVTLSVAGIPLSPKVDFFGKLFAAGGLLGTAFCLIFLEASHYIETKESLSEGEMHGHWAAMVLTGFITPIVIDFISKGLLASAVASPVEAKVSKASSSVSSAALMVAPAQSPSYELVESNTNSHNDSTAKGDDVGGTEKLRESTPPDHDQQQQQQHQHNRRLRILSAVLIGDFFHNFCDGIFIGVAFQSCATSFGWTVTSITVFHEIIQELSDFLVLTKAAQLPAWQALLWNACSGISVILGGIVIASAQVDDYTVGMLLAFGAGQYLYIGAVELMPMIHDPHHATTDMLQQATGQTVAVVADEEAHPASSVDDHRPSKASPGGTAMDVTTCDRIVGLVCFMVAVVVAGLILLNHEHCEVSSSDSHSGHNH